MARTSLVVVGSSWGGLQAIGTLLAGLPDDFGAAVVLAQHRAHTSTDALAHMFQARTALPLQEVEDKDAIATGHVYLAPSDYHLIVERGQFSLSVGERVQFSRPSIDVLFETAAIAYGPEVAAVVLTGANADGADGLVAVKRAGGIAIVQDPATAASPAMPEAAVASGAAEKVLPLSRIAPFLVELCRN
jgi:two-component system chemotaxis response regulator CheB